MGDPVAQRPADLDLFDEAGQGDSVGGGAQRIVGCPLLLVAPLDQFVEIALAWAARVMLERSETSSSLAMRQPSFSGPTRLATGTRTSSKNSSANVG